MASKKEKAMMSKFEAEMDARTLANAKAIESDKKRLSAAKNAATRLASDEQKRAKEAQASAQQMKNLASKPTSSKPSPKPSARPKARVSHRSPSRSRKTSRRK